MSFPLIKGILGKTCRRLGRPFLSWIKRGGATSPAIASCYYAFFHRTFFREQNTFLAGVAAYERNAAMPSGSHALLRRNTHRLEKGLLMRPRRVPFALDYIGETVNAYARAHAEGVTINEIESKWATDVLEEYFKLHEGIVRVAKYAELFSEAKGNCAICEEQRERQIPYVRDLSGPPPVTYDQLFALAERRRSVRWFLPEPVDRNLIDRALKLGTLGPSACNRQPFEFRIFDDAKLVEQIVSVPFGLAGYGHNVPVLVVVVGQQRHFFHERDRHLIYIDASLAVMGFLFGLESQGIASCCINWPDIEEKEMRMKELLGLADDERPIMLIALGHPDPAGMVARSTKKPLAQIRRYNEVKTTEPKRA